MRALASSALLALTVSASGSAQQPAAQGGQQAPSAGQQQVPPSGQQVLGQSGPQQLPTQGLFGGNLTGRPTSPDARVLDFNGSVYGGYDDSLAFEGEGDSAAADSGNVGAAASLAYYQRGRRVDFGATGAAAARYYPDYTEDGLTTSYYSGSLGLDARLSRRTSMSVNQTLAYTPYYQWSLAPMLGSPFAPPPVGQLPQLDLSYAATNDEALTTSTFASFQHQVSRRGYVGLAYALNDTNFLGEQAEGAAPDLTYQSILGTYRLGVGQYTGLDVGYGYQRGIYAGGPGTDADRRYEGHIFNGGVNYARSFGAAQRTTLSFWAGATGFSRDIESNYTGAGSVTFSYLFSPRWQLTSAYNRNVGFSPGLYEPTTFDSFTTSVIGLATRRLRLEFYGGYTSGTVGFDAPDSGFETILGSATLQYALSRHVALTGQYYYYRYDFAQGVDLAPGVVYVTDRQGVRGGLSFWWPLAR